MINHKNKFIFVHIPKTGGTSIEYFFTNETETSCKHFMPLDWIKHYPKEWNNYFKFSSVRNPWDKVVSQWTMEKQRYGNSFKKTFKEFVKYPQGFPLQPQLWFLSEPRIVKDQEIKKYIKENYNFIIKFENLDSDFKKLCNLIDISYQPLLQKYHSQDVRKSRPYQEYYDTETKDIVSRIYDIDIEYFGYEFEELT